MAASTAWKPVRRLGDNWKLNLEAPALILTWMTLTRQPH